MRGSSLQKTVRRFLKHRTSQKRYFTNLLNTSNAHAWVKMVQIDAYVRLFFFF